MSENEIQSRAVVIPPGELGMPVTVYNNSGSKVIYSAIVEGVPLSDNFVVGDNHVYIKSTGTLIYPYSGDGEFLGLSDVANSTTPVYKIGGTYSYSISLPKFYLVSYEWDKGEYETVQVEYNGEKLGEVTKGSPLTLECGDKPMRTNVTLTKI